MSSDEPSDDAAPTVVITLPDGTETASDAPDVDDRLSALFDRPVRLTTEAPEGSTYLAVWPEIDGVIPDDFLAQNSVTADEAEGALTDIGLALAAPGTFFDVSALHVVTEATLRRLGELAPESEFAVERYRPNLVLDTGDEPFAENEWAGSTFTVAEELQAMVLLPTMRCIMTTLAQGELPRDDERAAHRRDPQPRRPPGPRHLVVRRRLRRGDRGRPGPRRRPGHRRLTSVDRRAGRRPARGACS